MILKTRLKYKSLLLLPKPNTGKCVWSFLNVFKNSPGTLFSTWLHMMQSNGQNAIPLNTKTVPSSCSGRIMFFLVFHSGMTNGGFSSWP